MSLSYSFHYLVFSVNQEAPCALHLFVLGSNVEHKHEDVLAVYSNPGPHTCSPGRAAAPEPISMQHLANSLITSRVFLESSGMKAGKKDGFTLKGDFEVLSVHPLSTTTQAQVLRKSLLWKKGGVFLMSKRH